MIKQLRVIAFGILVALLLLLIVRSSGAVRSAVTPVTRPAEPQFAVLETPVPEIKFDKTPLNEAVSKLMDITGADIIVDWRALEAAAIDKNEPVSLRLHNVTLGTALDYLCRGIGGGTVRIGYTLDHRIVIVSTVEDLASKVYTRMYNIEDLIETLMRRSIDQSRRANEIRSAAATQPIQLGVEMISRKECVDEIIKMVEELVTPDAWKDVGGPYGAVREFSGLLIVTHEARGHQQVESFLNDLRTKLAETERPKP